VIIVQQETINQQFNQADRMHKAIEKTADQVTARLFNKKKAKAWYLI